MLKGESFAHIDDLATIGNCLAYGIWAVFGDAKGGLFAESKHNALAGRSLPVKGDGARVRVGHLETISTTLCATSDIKGYTFARYIFLDGGNGKFGIDTYPALHARGGKVGKLIYAQRTWEWGCRGIHHAVCGYNGSWQFIGCICYKRIELLPMMGIQCIRAHAAKSVRCTIYHQTVIGNTLVKTTLGTILEEEELTVRIRVNTHESIFRLGAEGERTRPIAIGWCGPPVVVDFGIGIEMGRAGTIAIPVARSHKVPIAGSWILASSTIVGIVEVHGSQYVTYLVADNTNMCHLAAA